jgi:hypothetical protein
MVKKEYEVSSVKKGGNVRNLFRTSMIRLGGEEVADNLYGNDIYHCSELRTTVVYYPQDFEAAIVGGEESRLVKTALELERVGKIGLEEL